MENEEPKNVELTREERIQILLAEYKAAQNSAQHHDTLVWTVTSIFWAANILLIRVVVTVLIENNNLKCLPIALSLLGLFLCLSVCTFARQFNASCAKNMTDVKKLNVDSG